MQFVGIAWAGDDAAFQGFIDTHGLTFPTISDPDGVLYDRFGVPQQPALVVIRSDGTTEALFGAVEPELLRSILTNIAQV